MTPFCAISGGAILAVQVKFTVFGANTSKVGKRLPNGRATDGASGELSQPLTAMTTTIQ